MYRIIVSIVTITLLLAGCSKAEDVSFEDKGFVEDSYYISAEELVEIIDDENLIIIDAREEKDYKKGHIKGAINVVWQQLSNVRVDSYEEGFGVVLKPHELEKVLQDIGINNESKIVVYSNGQDGWGEDGRILWSLTLYGFKNIKVLDGSYEYYKDLEYPTSKEITTLPKGNINLNSYDNSIVISTYELEELIENNSAKIVDTRSSNEYNGTNKYGETKGGRIPTSINIPLTELFNEYGRVKTKEEVDKIFSEANISKDDLIVTYCTAGIRSAYTFVVLKSYGYDNVLNYDESFYRWSYINEVE